MNIMQRAVGFMVIAWTGTLLSPGRILAAGCPGDPLQSVGPDVVVANITAPMNFSLSGTHDAFTLGSDACNLGNQMVFWGACPLNTHPVFGGNLYKWHTVNAATRFEQLGQSWLKNGFGADQGTACCANCQPSGDFHKLGIGCNDAYKASQAATQNSLSPKSIVNAHTGFYPGGCTIHPTGLNIGYVEAQTSELVETEGGDGAEARLFCQLQYITADEALAHNQNNNASSREMATTFVGGTGGYVFSFAAGSSTFVSIPAIRQWKMIDPDVVETDIDTPEEDGFPGLVIMAVKATDLGNGTWHYEYAINNLNSDRSIALFSVPCGPYVTVQNIGFHDVAYRGGDGIGGIDFDGTDWPGTLSGGAIVWATTPFAISANANAIRWGTLYNFRFDADVPPTNGTVTLGEYKIVTNVTAATVIPSSVTCIKGDLNGDGAVNGADVQLFSRLLVAGIGTAIQKCAGDVQAPANGTVDDGDVDPFIECLLGGGCH